MLLITSSTLLQCLLSLIFGIALAIKNIHIHALLLTPFALVALHSKKHSHIFFIAICFFLGQARVEKINQNQFQQTSLLNKEVNCIGTIQSIKEAETKDESTTIILNLSKIQINKKNFESSRSICIFLPHYIKHSLQPGQLIKFYSLKLKQPTNASYKQYLIKEGIWAVSHCKYRSYFIIQQPSWPMKIINEIRTIATKSLKNKLTSKAYNLYSSIFLGKKIKNNDSHANKQRFQLWGISHHLARSGLHVAILIGMLLFIFTLLPLSLRVKHLVVIFIITIYYLITLSSIAFMRAMLMYGLYTLCKIINAPANPLHILLLTSFLILTNNPYQLIFLDFQLSFFATFIIMWFYNLRQKQQIIAS